MYIYIYICVCVCVYIYIYLYVLIYYVNEYMHFKWESLPVKSQLFVKKNL